MIGLVLHALWVSALLGLAAASAETVARGLRLPTRWLWGSALLGSVALVGWGLAAPHLSTPAVASAVASSEVEAQALLSSEGDAKGATGAPSRIPGVGWLHALAGVPDLAAATAARWVPVHALHRSDAAARFFLAGWAAASLLLVGLLAGGALRHRRTRLRWPRKTVLGHRVRLIPEGGPAVAGLGTPEILLPRWALELPEAELRLLLRHEEEHRLARDPLLLGAASLLVALAPWNPLLWWQLRRLRDALEVDCDARVLGRTRRLGWRVGRGHRLARTRRLGSGLVWGHRPGRTHHPAWIHRLWRTHHLARTRRLARTQHPAHGASGGPDPLPVRPYAELLLHVASRAPHPSSRPHTALSPFVTPAMGRSSTQLERRLHAMRTRRSHPLLLAGATALGLALVTAACLADRPTPVEPPTDGVELAEAAGLPGETGLGERTAAPSASAATLPEDGAAAPTAGLLGFYPPTVNRVEESGSEGEAMDFEAVTVGNESVTRVHGASSPGDGESPPLLVVDGVALSSATSLADTRLDAGDIASVEVIRGAAARSAYGEGAENGVILITTHAGAARGAGGGTPPPPSSH